MSLLPEKVALVTGAAQGLGLATTRLLLKHGAKVNALLLRAKCIIRLIIYIPSS